MVINKISDFPITVKCDDHLDMKTKAEFWAITPQLRWFNKCAGNSVCITKVLQQLHTSSLGNRRWVDVPTEKE